MHRGKAALSFNYMLKIDNITFSLNMVKWTLQIWWYRKNTVKRQLLHNMYNSKTHFSKEFVEMYNNSFYCSYSALCSCTYCGGQYQNTFCWVFQNKFAWAGILQAVLSPEVQLSEIYKVKFQKQETGKLHLNSCALRMVLTVSKVDIHHVNSVGIYVDLFIQKSLYVYWKSLGYVEEPSQAGQSE